MEFRVLGSLEVVDHDGPVALGAPKQRALLAVLLLHSGEPVSSDRLIDEIWGERPPASANKIVQGYVSSLRKVLGDGRLVTHGRGYVLRVEAGQTDVDRFEALAAKGRRALEDGDAVTAGAVLREALAVWRGPALNDFAYQPFAQSAIARLEESRLVVLEDRIDADLASGEHARLVGELEGLVREHPLRERLQGQLMLALYRSGRQADALETYHLARDRLIDELGLEPGPELKELQRAILEQDPALALNAPRREQEVLAAARRGRRGGLLIAAGGALLLAAMIAVAVTIAGSGGSMVRVAPNSIAAIDVRSDRVVATAEVGDGPGPVAYGYGSLWVANLDDQTVARVDPRTPRTVGTIPVGDPPTGVAAAGGGIWVATSGPTATFVSARRIDPQFEAIDRTVRVRDVVPGSPAAVAAGGSRLWVAPSFGALTALDPATGRVTQQRPPDDAPQAIGVGAGAVWLADNEADTVTRVDRTGLVQHIAVGHSPSGIAVGAGGVWVAATGDDKVVRIDPSTRAVTTTIPVGHLPIGVAVGARSVWVANSGDGTVTRIDPASNKPIATITVGGSPRQITVAQGRAWVTVDAPTIQASSTAAGAGTVRIDTYGDYGPLDPANPAADVQLMHATCANLLTYPDKPGVAGSQLVPEVAQSLPKRSPDGRSYTFTIRRGFRFSPPSTETVTARTFKYSIERILNPRMSDGLAADFRDIVGAPAYMAGKSADVSGVIARGNALTIRLTAPAPDILQRTAMPTFCAVPTNTPTDHPVPNISSAGPYYVENYTPGAGVLLARNPNYRGNRPHRAARIVISFGASAEHAIEDVEAGTVDYAAGTGFDSANYAALAARYGPGSPPAKRGHQQLFISTLLQLDAFVLNTHRPLFSDVRLRQAVNYAIDRTALARLGDVFQPVSEHPTGHYLPPGVPGYRDVPVYPLTPDLAKARQLARGHRGATVVLITCNVSPCLEQAQIVTNNLAAIGLRVDVKPLTSGELYAKLATPGAFDMGWSSWEPDYLDPAAMLYVLLEQGEVSPTLVDSRWRARLAAASRLTGTERYQNYARLDAELAREAAPLAAFGNQTGLDFFSSRIGCQVLTPAYGIDLAALCVRQAHK